MNKTAMIRARMEPELKEQAEDVLRELGLSPTHAITIFYREVVRRQGLPFALRLKPEAALDEPIGT